ncbi:hypothetical protein E1B28_005667 [Marasmius oreades]|uniref:Xylanolytic transcriptional activator regulatory domain-containing protein n=1 Tax=Marasmius oreades TaxID=181124 RepID=A0A9P7S3Q2_9AGAR|nr:uncharacterized protein E1B28_005667 [Marasmius oreades]KAG7094859.1 hypothetical protein E1B28_005667 [Marasmius oreades]
MQLEECEIEEAKGHISAILSTSSSYKLAEDQTVTLKILVLISCYARHLETQLKQSTSPVKSLHSSSTSPEPDNLPRPVPFQCDLPHAKEEEAERDLPLSDGLRHLHFGNTDAKDTYYGKGSNVMLLKTAFNVKAATSGQEPTNATPKRPEFWTYFPFQRTIYEQATPLFMFPDVDLIFHLVALYFDKFQLSIKMLHRPSFERNVFEGLYIRNRAFGALLLTVCGLAARYSDDPRVLIEGGGELSAGWKWINQLRPFEILSWDAETGPSVHELQALCNYIMFIQPTTAGNLTWPLVSLGFRYAHVVGAHRNRFMERKSLAEQELWKRVFWVLIAIDAYSSAFYGRPRCTTPIDFNQEFPLEVDDEYWEHPDPDKCFKQPPGKPSTITFWVQFMKLLRVLGIAQRSYLGLNKRGLENHIWGIPDDEKVLTELDSLLNVWIDQVPEHLRWNLNRDQPNSVFFNQSATIHSIYYWVQIQIHCPFISIPGRNDKSPGLSYSSLAVCSNAARSCIRLLDIQANKGVVDWTTGQMSLYSSAMVLTLNLWGNFRLGLSIDPTRHIQDVHRCISVLRRFEPRWQKAGGIIDIITEILNITELPTTACIASKKRSRTENDDARQNPFQQPSHEPVTDLENWWSNPTSDVSSSAGYTAGRSNSSFWDLPLYTEDLSSGTGFFDSVQAGQAFGGEFQQGQETDAAAGDWISQTEAAGEDFGSSAFTGYASLAPNSNSADLWVQAVGGDAWEDWARYFGANV